MKYRANREGFTLLELLLVVGIASILIISGITTYNLVTRNSDINDTVSLVNVLSDQVRKLYGSQNDYGPRSNDIEAALLNIGVVPARYQNEATSQIRTPFDSSDNAIRIFGGSTVTGVERGFFMRLSLPPNIVPEVLSQFDPQMRSDVFGVSYCGSSLVQTINITDMTVQCGSSREIPSSFNVAIVFE